MATYTNNLELVKPELNDLISPTVFADNFDKIDAAYGDLNSNFGHMRTVTVTTNQFGVANISLNPGENRLNFVVSNTDFYFPFIQAGNYNNDALVLIMQYDSGTQRFIPIGDNFKIDLKCYFI